jgi:hypothetical protein
VLLASVARMELCEIRDERSHGISVWHGALSRPHSTVLGWRNGFISAKPCTGRHVFFHRYPEKPNLIPTSGPHRRTTGIGPVRLVQTTVSHRRLGGFTRTPARGMDLADGRSRLFRPMEADQEPLFPAACQDGRAARKKSTGEYELWQSRFWEHTIRDESDFAYHIEYIHYNPVKHGLVKRVRDWPYSTFHRDVAAGLYSPDWGGGTLERNGDDGESTGEPP